MSFLFCCFRSPISPFLDSFYSDVLDPLFLPLQALREQIEGILLLNFFLRGQIGQHILAGADGRKLALCRLRADFLSKTVI